MDEATLRKANQIKVLSWNLDGLDNVSLPARTNAAIDIITREEPDVVFLQEVVALSWSIIKMDRLLTSTYRLVPADPNVQYFTAVLVNKTTVFVDDERVRSFHTSMMMRKLQILHVNVKGIDIKLMNTHLESTAQHAVERLRQFKICLEEMIGCDSKYNVIFGGDLNLGTKDLQNIELPPGIVDVWEGMGSKNETRYTWDTRYNDNKQMSGGGKPRCRFDRIYIRSSEKKDIVPSSFHLAGIERAKGCSRFPSDHWAISCVFHIKE